MITLINLLVAITGLTICTIFLLSDKFDTVSKETILQLSLWIASWLCLIEASFPSSNFEPSLSSTAARTIVLILNIWHFKELIIDRFKNKHTAI